MILALALRRTWLLAALCLAAPALAQVPIPTLATRVTDQTGTLTPVQSRALESKLQAFEAQKGSQIAILIVPTTGAEAIEQFGIRVADAWKIGRSKVDDGAILIVAKNDHALRIEVGYGLEGALNDATAKRIISESIVPLFRQGDFYGGLDAGVDQMMRVINGEALPPPAPRATRQEYGIGQLTPVIFILVIVVGSILRALLGRLPAAIVAGSGAAIVAWFIVGAAATALGAGVLAFLFTLIGGGIGMGGAWNSGGGSGRNGLGGGGFGGGGGGFGGGGASGKW